MSGTSNTQYFKVKTEPEIQVKEVLNVVYNAMAEKGYNPVNQIVGYIMSGELVEELLKEYIKNESWKRK